ncbi:ATP-binding protein [Salinivibrio costicola]|uniref:ATP-binding protein n=1 Tax=Salinivibrio costicola TaxID=51367 RepID=UPI00047133D3|nr:ATP-binding protein [Salinivibrio costicola]
MTTFRLKLEGSNLHEALQESFKQLSDRFSDKEIKFNNEIKNMPFSATEQVHLLQIAREAVQNAIHHSEGSKIVILLTSRKKNGYVTLLIHDDGIGIDTSAKKETTMVLLL